MIDNTFSIHALGKLWSTNINEDVYVRQCLLGSPLLGKRMNTPGQPFIHNFKQGPRALHPFDQRLPSSSNKLYRIVTATRSTHPGSEATSPTEGRSPRGA
jgi:hypothetical protein